MEIKVLFFATLRDLVGTKSLTVTLPDHETTVMDVRRELTNRYPQIADHLSAALAAINEEFAFKEDVVQTGDEVAFFPPVSGGQYAEICSLADTPINHDALVASITTSDTGAVCVFSGMVRGETRKDGHIPETSYLEYEAYEPMAIAKMNQVVHEIRERWSQVQGIAILQRIGRLEVGQNTIVIACASGHRDQGCFEAARYGIDRLKEIVPVWKKEVGPDGEAWIEGEYTPTTEDRAG